MVFLLDLISPIDFLPNLDLKTELNSKVVLSIIYKLKIAKIL